MAARSFCTAGALGDGLLRALKDARADVPTPTGGLVFVSGPLASKLPEIAGRVRAAWKGVPVCMVPAGGVLWERGEVEGSPAVSGILWNGVPASVFVIGDDEPNEAASDLFSRQAAKTPGTVLMFCRSEGFDSDLITAVADAARGAPLFGGGAAYAAPMGLNEAGEILSGRAVGMQFAASAAPILDHSPACRLLSSFEPIEEVSSGLVLRLGKKAALDQLSACAPSLAQKPGQPAPVVMGALAEQAPGNGRPRFLLRPIRGVDPGRRGIMLGPDAKPGMYMAFAMRDGASARADMDAMIREVARNALGAAPRFAICLSCAGRGQGLYGAPDVETRMLRQRFGDLPIAGMHSAFEIAPLPPLGQPRLHLYTAVLALFRSPS